MYTVLLRRDQIHRLALYLPVLREVHPVSIEPDRRAGVIMEAGMGLRLIKLRQVRRTGAPVYRYGLLIRWQLHRVAPKARFHRCAEINRMYIVTIYD